MDRALTWALTISAALTLATPALAETREVTQADGAWQAVVCVGAGRPHASRVAEMKAQAAIVREREAHRIYGHEAHAPESMGGNQLRVASYSSGRVRPIRTATWGERDADTGSELSCVRVVEGGGDHQG